MFCTRSTATAGWPAATAVAGGRPRHNTSPENSSADEKLSLSDQIVQDVLEPLRTGVETQNIKQILSVFDKHDFSGYGDLEQQLRAFFRQYQQVNFRYQILQAAIEKDHASATAEIDMDALPYTVTDDDGAPQRADALPVETGAGKGWKVVGFSPSNFFSLDRPADQ